MKPPKPSGHFSKRHQVPDSSFYTQQIPEKPLDDLLREQSISPAQKLTSRHKPPRLRESSNRVGVYHICLLWVRAIIIVAAIGGGVIMVKTITRHLENPTEAQKQRWAEHAQRLREIGTGGAVAQQLEVIDAESLTAGIEQQMIRWDAANRNLNAAKAALQRRGIEGEAVERLQQTLQASPENREALQLLFTQLLREEKYAEAVPLAVKLMHQDSSDVNMQIRFLQTLQYADYTAAAITVARRLLELRPDSIPVLEIAAQLRIEDDDLDGALDVYQHILSLDHRNITALRGASAILSSRGDWTNAAPHYVDLARNAPDEESFKWLAISYAQLVNAERAVSYLGQAASLYGSPVVAGWIQSPGFDPIRETDEFRVYVDFLADAETRRAIETLRRHEIERRRTDRIFQIEMPKRPSLLDSMKN
ncbi:MAG: hypothetical protein WC959_00090 [Kiritimatiellales bacterium]